jgi:hypothetical protein
MKHNTGSRRPRNRSGGGGGGNKRHGGGRNSFESNGPEVKVRGTAQQVLEKYLALGRDAATAGDRIKSEAYFQYAEHYYRIANADGAPGNNTNQNQNQNQNQHRRGSHPQGEPAQVVGSGPQPEVDPQIPAEASATEAEVISTVPESIPVASEETNEEADDVTIEASPNEGKIDESVLPAAAPTTPAPRRRRRTKVVKADKEEAPETSTEPEVAQA